MRRREDRGSAYGKVASNVKMVSSRQVGQCGVLAGPRGGGPRVRRMVVRRDGTEDEARGGET